jgi:hypothetical protein
MKYRLIYKDEDFREELFDELEEISTRIEGYDWISGNYEVFDENNIQYIARWIIEPSEKAGLFGINSLEVGRYKLVPIL